MRLFTLHSVPVSPTTALIKALSNGKSAILNISAAKRVDISRNHSSIRNSF